MANLIHIKDIHTLLIPPDAKTWHIELSGESATKELFDSVADVIKTAFDTKQKIAVISLPKGAQLDVEWDKRHG